MSSVQIRPRVGAFTIPQPVSNPYKLTTPHQKGTKPPRLTTHASIPRDPPPRTPGRANRTHAKRPAPFPGVAKRAYGERMPGGGSKPGERRGGRKPGTRNRKTLEQLKLQAANASRVVEIAARDNRKLAKDVLEEFMLLFAGMAAVSQPLPPGAVATPGRIPHDEKFEKYATLAVDCAKALAKYQSPTFRAIVIAPPPPTGPTEQRKRFTLTIFDGERPSGVAHVDDDRKTG